jgi:HK97 family phage prohead protease
MSITENASSEAGVSVRREAIRAVSRGPQIRAAEDGGMPTLFGHFAVFNRWTEINSWFEGNFLERIAPGSLRKTISENRDKIKALFQHGQDPQIGDKPLGPISDLREDEQGGYYEVPLLDTAYNRDLIPGLEEAGLYGASFRFEVMREEFDEEPDASEHNPRGLPERTIKEIRLHEFGPVTFPAYAEATSGVRSLTDQFLFEQIARDPTEARALLGFDPSQLIAPSDPPTPPVTGTSGPERREPHIVHFDSRKDWLGWLTSQH